MTDNTSSKKLLLHVCCAPCATSPLEQLIEEFDVTLFFSNSNIFPKEEYEKRLDFAKKLAAKFDVELNLSAILMNIISGSILFAAWKTNRKKVNVVKNVLNLIFPARQNSRKKIISISLQPL